MDTTFAPLCYSLGMRRGTRKRQKFPLPSSTQAPRSLPGMRSGTRPKGLEPTPSLSSQLIVPVPQATQPLDNHVPCGSYFLPAEVSFPNGRQTDTLFDDKQPELEPITTFSTIKGSSDVISAGSHMNRSILNNSTVIEMLISLLCRQYEPNVGKREKLFKAFCSLVKRWNTSFYIQLHDIPDIQELQSEVLETFEGFLRNAQSQLLSGYADLVLPRHIPLIPHKHQTFLDDRYSREFTEVGLLGRGGFGVVVKVKNNLDGRLYAVKIVPLRQEDIETTLREVQALANLEHPHIVRYHSTWFQPFVLPRHLHTGTHHPSGKLLHRPTNPHKALKTHVVGKTTDVRMEELPRSNEENNQIKESCESSRNGFKSEKFFCKSRIQRTFSAIYENTEYSSSSKLEIPTDRHLVCAGDDNQLDFEIFEPEDVVQCTISQPCVSPFFQPKPSSIENQKVLSSSSDDDIVFQDSQVVGHQKVPKSIVKIQCTSGSDSCLKVSSTYQRSTSSSDTEFLSKNSSCSDEVSSPGTDCKLLSVKTPTMPSVPIVHKNCIVPYSSHDKGKHFTAKQPQLTLFIQMGLCGKSLGDWLHHRRKTKCAVNRCQCLTIFQQILLAVQYLHSKNMIHRDIKPANIFFTLDNNLNIQLGDFGLVRFLSAASANRVSSVSEVDRQASLSPTEWTPGTQGVGTPIYAAPEIGLGSQYDSKSDMHSLGIILLELFQPFTTGAERIHVINALKIKRILDQDLTDQWPDVAEWILRLTHPEPSHRPSCDELLESPLFKASESSSFISTVSQSFQLNDVTDTTTSSGILHIDLTSPTQTLHQDSTANTGC